MIQVSNKYSKNTASTLLVFFASRIPNMLSYLSNYRYDCYCRSFRVLTKALLNMVLAVIGLRFISIFLALGSATMSLTFVSNCFGIGVGNSWFGFSIFLQIYFGFGNSWFHCCHFFKLRQGASMGSNCWMDGWMDGRSVGGKKAV